MTVNEAILRADELRPNPFGEEQKIRWLSELDGKIAKEILNVNFTPYEISENGERELMAEEAYCDLYLFYLCAMTDFFSRDYGEYNNSLAMFNSAYSSYAKAVKNSGTTKSGKTGQYYKNIF